MYEPSADFQTLRQGDVIRGLYLPRFSISQVQLLHELDPAGALQFKESGLITVEERYAVVLSQCCEFNAGKRLAFSLARMEGVKERFFQPLRVWGINVAELVRLARSPFKGKQGHEHETAAELERANDVNGQLVAANLFYYAPHGAEITEPFVVDFSQITSIRMKDAGLVLSRKIAQLNDETRRMLQKKVALFFGRIAT